MVLLPLSTSSAGSYPVVTVTGANSGKTITSAVTDNTAPAYYVTFTMPGEPVNVSLSETAAQYTASLSADSTTVTFTTIDNLNQTVTLGTAFTSKRLAPKTAGYNVVLDEVKMGTQDITSWFTVQGASGTITVDPAHASTPITGNIVIKAHEVGVTRTITIKALYADPAAGTKVPIAEPETVEGGVLVAGEAKKDNSSDGFT